MIPAFHDYSLEPKIMKCGDLLYYIRNKGVFGLFRTTYPSRWLIIFLIVRELLVQLQSKLKLKLLGILATSNVVLSVKSLLTETTTSLAARMSNSFALSIFLLGSVHKLCLLKIGDFEPPLPLIVFFLLIRVYLVNHLWGYPPPPIERTQVICGQPVTKHYILILIILQPSTFYKILKINISFKFNKSFFKSLKHCTIHFRIGQCVVVLFVLFESSSGFYFR